MPDKKMTELSESDELPEAPSDAVKADDDAFKAWYDSVEARFQDLGDYIKSGKVSHESPRQKASAEIDRGQSAPDEASDSASRASSTRDIRPPKPNHWWFRRLGE